MQDLDWALGREPALEQRGRLLRLLIAKLPAAICKEKWGLVLADLKQAEAAGAASAGLYDDLGAVYQNQQQYAEAIAAYTKGLNVAKDDTKLLIERGWAYVEQKQWDPAQEDFTAVVRQEARTDDERVRRAEAYTGLGYVSACRAAAAEAQRAANRALAALQGTNHPIVQHNLACIYAELSRLEPQRRADDEALALEFLQRELVVADRAGVQDEARALIAIEAAFGREFRERKEFKALLAR